MEECLLANSITAIVAEMKGLYNMLEEATEELITLNKRLCELAAHPLIHYEVGMDEGQRQDDTEDGRDGEEARGGDAEEAQEGRNDGSGSSGVQAVLPGKGEAEEGTEEGETGRDGAEEPDITEVVATDGKGS